MERKKTQLKDYSTDDLIDALPVDANVPLDAFSLYKSDIGKMQIDRDANFRCGLQILEGQFAVFQLTRIKEELELTNMQLGVVDAVLSRTDVEKLKEGFDIKVNKTNVSDSMRDAQEAFMQNAAERSALIDWEIDMVLDSSPEKRSMILDEILSRNTEVALEAEEALNELVLRNLRLGVNVAKKFGRNPVSLLDRCQFANDGIMHAAKIWDPVSGYQFSTVASLWASQRLHRALDDHESSIRVPRSIRRDYRAHLKTIESKVQELGRELSEGEIQRLLGGDMERFQIARTAQATVSLNKPLTVDDGTEFELSDTLVSPERPVEEQGIHNVLRSDVYNVLCQLQDREREVLELRFGLKDGRPQTLDQVGLQFGVTRERARQIEAKALQKIKRANPRLKSYLE